MSIQYCAGNKNIQEELQAMKEERLYDFTKLIRTNHQKNVNPPPINPSAMMASTTITALLASLKAADLLPSPIIPKSFAPCYNLTVAFPALTPQNGDLARVSQVKEQPVITMSPITSSPSDATFTFMQIDPDAPTPADPKYGYWRHWIVSNIALPSDAAPDANIIDSGRTVTPYLAPGPTNESGPHRYLFLLFKECGGKGLEKADVGGDEFVDRRSFRAEKIVQEKGLELVGVQWMRGVGDGWVEGNGQS